MAGRRDERRFKMSTIKLKITIIVAFGTRRNEILLSLIKSVL